MYPLNDKILLFHSDNLPILQATDSESIDLIYIDPPYNTNKIQKRGELSYEDSYEDFNSFLVPRLVEAHRILKKTGSLFVHLDYREVHYIKIELDKIFGRNNFVNEIIWQYDYGARSKSKWSAKHDTILFYAKDSKNYTYNYDNIDRIPYMAPSLQKSKERAELGKTPTDVWWFTIVPTMSKEKTGYPTQKPLNMLERIVKVHSNEGDMCMDFFAGSGTFGEACCKNNRYCILCDQNKQSVEVIKKRIGEKI